MPETRCDHYKVPEVESFMVKILGEKKRVEPIFDLKLGYRYPDVEEAVGMDTGKTIDFLGRLFNLEILDREVFDMELRCPKCNSPNVSINYICPHCSSSIIQRTVLLEHYDCGYLGTATSFGEPLVCPKCGARVGEGDYRDAGSIYECADCKRQIETPFAGHRCRECSFKFSFENAVYLPKYAYFPAELTRKEMERGILYLSKVVNVFEELEFKRDVNSRAAGKSGVEHAFDAAFTRLGAKFYVDIFFSLDPTGEQDVLREYGKVRDVNANIFLIVLPGLDDEATVLAKSYNMNTVEAENPEEALSKLKVALTEKLAELKQAPAKGKAVKKEKAKRRRLFGR